MPTTWHQEAGRAKLRATGPCFSRQGEYARSLCCAGRIKELINRGGEKISPIEASLGDLGHGQLSVLGTLCGGCALLPVQTPGKQRWHAESRFTKSGLHLNKCRWIACCWHAALLIHS